MAEVRFVGASRFYPGTERPAVHALDLHIPDKEFLVLVGPSGCGKSTSLRMLAGLEPVDGGRILIGDEDVTDVPPRDRDIAMVFQTYALYPHMTVKENISFHLRIKRMPKDEQESRIAEAARLLDLTEYLARKPGKLSGGQRQRVAMGRAIVREPQVFLMDEPLSNLDAKLRVQTRAEILALQKRLEITTVYVTHDQVEAMTMGDRVAVLKDGLLQQVAPPHELFHRPVNAFVAGFIGSPAMNLVEAALDADGVRLGTLVVPLSPAQRSAVTSAAVTVGVRPGSVDLVGEGDAAEGTTLDASVGLVEELGAESFLSCRVDGHRDPFVVRVAGRSPVARGATVRLRPRPDTVHLFDTATGLRLPD